jgi:hypothetical protein
MLKTSFVGEPHKFFELLNTPTEEISDVNFINQEVVEVRHRTNLDFLELSPNTSVVMAAFVTCQARLKLYNALDILDRRVLYFDTDSVIFISKVGLEEPTLGDYLGDFTSEVPSGCKIVRFCSGGPKNYGYELDNGEKIMKVRGISLNYTSLQVVNFDVLVEMILNNVKTPVVVTEPHKIVRNRQTREIHAKRTEKRYAVVYDKRVRMTNFDTLPYGHKEI